MPGHPSCAGVVDLHQVQALARVVAEVACCSGGEIDSVNLDQRLALGACQNSPNQGGYCYIV